MYELDLNKLKNCRKSKGLTLQEASEKLGAKSYNKLWALENGQSSVKAVDLRTLAQIYETDIEEFFLKRGMGS